ncbi:MAG: hypothetical protein KC618_08210, partial [Candidatus Omnitrophica bacterium]|nr:hypothetical protein [Candidatus Omnitrophota bacterium]
MKKVFLTFIIIFVSIYVVFSFLGRKSDYVLEKKLWKINQELGEYAKDPLSVPDRAFIEIAERCNALVSKYDHSRLKPVLRITSARAYMYAKEYKTAREQLELVISENKENQMMGSQALADIGRTYALEENSGAVLATYQRMLDEFPLTSLGLSTPLYIAKYYADKGLLAKASSAYDNAVLHYQKIANEHKGTLLGINAQKLIGTCYNAQQKWDDAINVFKEILLESPPELMTMQSVSAVVRSVNRVAIVKLNSFDIPIEIYGEFIKRNPGHDLNPHFQSLIDGFTELKNKNVKV